MVKISKMFVQKAKEEKMGIEYTPLPEGTYYAKLVSAEKASNTDGFENIVIDTTVVTNSNGEEIEQSGTKKRTFLNFQKDYQASSAINIIESLLGEKFETVYTEDENGNWDFDLDKAATAISLNVGMDVQFDINHSPDKKNPGKIKDWTKNLRAKETKTEPTVEDKTEQPF